MPNLIITRKVGETIVLNEEITIMYLRFSNGEISVGIEAPREVSIRRGELTRRPDGRAADARIDQPPAGGPQEPSVAFRKRKVTLPPDEV